MMFKHEPTINQQVSNSLKLIKKLLSISLIRYLIVLILIIILIPVGIFIWLRPQVQKDINYGTTFSKKYSEQMGLDWKYTYLQILDDLKVKNLRLVVYWDDSEPEPDKYNFDDIKWQLEEAKKRNVNVILAMGRKVPRYPECFTPSWWASLKENQKNEALYEYIGVVTTELKSYPNIKMWQVENEPFWPFGECQKSNDKVIKREVQMVRSLDNRPILVQDSGEGGFWFPTYKLGDYLGISMYRKIWYDFWGIFFGDFIYFQYPLAHWTYKIKADLVGVPYNKILVTELQAEPWGPGLNSTLSQEEIDKTMSKHHFIDTLNYAQKAGFKDLYFWGAEWWLFEKEHKGNSFYWDTAKALFNN